jgi:hypothetical protein
MFDFGTALFRFRKRDSGVQATRTGLLGFY